MSGLPASGPAWISQYLPSRRATLNPDETLRSLPGGWTGCAFCCPAGHWPRPA